MKKEEKKELETKEELKDKKAKKEKKSKKNAKPLTPEEAAAKEANKIVLTKCIAAILCAVIVALSVSSAFGKLAEAVKAGAVATPIGGSVSDTTSDEEDFFGDDTSADAPAADDNSTTDAPAADGEASTDAPAADGEASTDAPAADSDAPAKDDAANKKPSTTAEVLTYFNTAANKVKTDAKEVEQKSVKNYLDKPATISSGIKSVYNMLGGDDWLNEMLIKNSQGAATYKGADIKAHFPVEGESWASKLTPADVKGATCTEANGVYTIKIMTKDDAKSDSIVHGQGHNPKAFNVILPGVVNDNIPGIATSLVGTASMNYPASTIVATIDAKTGNMISATYDLKWTINFDKMGIILPFATTSIYNIKW